MMNLIFMVSFVFSMNVSSASYMPCDYDFQCGEGLCWVGECYYGGCVAIKTCV